MNSRTQKKHGYRYRREWLLRAVVIDQVDGRTFGRGPYHNIRHVGWAVTQFMRSMKILFPTATHINFYNYKKEFLFQERFEAQQSTRVTRTKLQPRSYYDNLFSVTGESRYYNQLIFAQFEP